MDDEEDNGTTAHYYNVTADGQYYNECSNDF